MTIEDMIKECDERITALLKKIDVDGYNGIYNPTTVREKDVITEIRDKLYTMWLGEARDKR